MRSLLLVGILGMAAVTVPIASADIYFWTDENGVKNFTNYSPPEKAEVFMETSEVDEERVPPGAETDRSGDTERSLESEHLQAAAEEVEALREQVNELKNRLAALPEPPPIEPGDGGAEAEEATNTVRYRSGYVYWPYPYGYPPYGYKTYHKFGPRHGHGRPGYKKRIAHPNRFKTHDYGRQPPRHGHGSVDQRPGYRSFRKGAYHTGSGRQYHTLGRHPRFGGGGKSRR